MLVFSIPVHADCEADLKSWLAQEKKIAVIKLLENISPPDALPGVVIAARTRKEPNYYYHWVRDAGLVIEAALETYAGSDDQALRSSIRAKVAQYATISSRLQNVETLTGLGEPKFNVDGTAYNEPWGRPQDDGPAIRASSLIAYATILLHEGDFKAARVLYNHDFSSPIKRDLEYTAKNWRQPNFDLWEEVLGDHFFTRMVQRRALREGAHLALALGDSGAARFYNEQAQLIEASLAEFYDAKTASWMTTLRRTAGLDYKASNVDSAIVLGLIHGLRPGEMIRVNDDLILSWSSASIRASVDKVAAAFKDIYSVNQNPQAPGIAIGRYPEDRYSGNSTEGGNPWPLTTLSMAQALYENAVAERENGEVARAEALIQAGDLYVARVQFHAFGDGSLSEQIDHKDGHMTSVSDLTWNYAAILTTEAARRRAAKN